MKKDLVTKDPKLIKKLLLQSKSIEEAAYYILGKHIESRLFYHVFSNRKLERAYSKEYDNYFKHKINSYGSILKAFFMRTNFLKVPGDFVDLGCGSGLLLAILANKIKKHSDNSKYNFYGIDKSLVMLELAKKNLSDFNVDNVVLIPGDLNNLVSIIKQYKIKPRYIFSLNVLHQIEQPEKLIKDAYYILEKDGWLFLETIIRDSNWRMKKKRLIHLLDENPKMFIPRFKGHLSALTINEIDDLLKKSRIKKYKLFKSKRKGYYDQTLTIVIHK